MQLTCDRVTLREFSESDVAEYQRYHADPRYLRYYAPEAADPKLARRLVEMFIGTAEQVPRRDFTLAVVERTSCRLIGCCSLRTSKQKDRCADFGLEMSPDRWGRGLATEAASALLGFGFDALGLAEIHGESVTENRRVDRLVSKLGFRKLSQRLGAAWMKPRGWTYTSWSLKKTDWAQLH